MRAPSVALWCFRSKNVLIPPRILDLVYNLKARITLIGRTSRKEFAGTVISDFFF